jgi:hypothetical protein
VKTRVLVIAGMWAAVVGLVAGSAQAQSPTQPGGQFVLVGVVLLEGGRGLAWVQEPNFTNNKVVTVRLGDSVGPYRVTKILTHQVELTGPAGSVSIPLAGVPGAVSVASSAGPVRRPAREVPPGPALSDPDAIVIPRGDPSRNFPASKLLVGAGAVVTGEGSQARKPQASQPRAAAAPELPPLPAPNSAGVIIIPRGDPNRNFPASKLLVGAGAVITGER